MKYKETFSRDKQLSELVEKQKAPELAIRENVFLQLIGSIMSQQLSTKVAAVIHQRFLNLYGGREPEPEQVLNTSHETLRSIGLSNAKSIYVHNVSKFAAEKKLELALLQAMNEEELIEHLTQIKGVGRWTAEMILMFALAKEDVFAIDDLGIQNAMKSLYKLNMKDKKKFRQALVRISNNWSPYRTYACLYLWGYKDNTPVVGEKKQKKKTKSAPRKNTNKKVVAKKTTKNKTSKKRTVKKRRSAQNTSKKKIS
ncbi:MAG: DNA-3-methyladenine glycosylase 2 family protein [Bacteroidetes bacterium]|nr:MAG: DNA-3-methyladenine glycosylase 2 family protein [Bacteroidota bacterium]